MVLETEGKQAGCWVLRLAGSEGFAGMEEPDKILVRSNGTVTYTAKDIAYQLWKFGLLGADFDYERLAPDWNSGAVTPDEIPAAVRDAPGLADGPRGRSDPDAPSFGRATRVSTSSTSASPTRRRSCARDCACSASRQEADRSEHFSYEIVALSPKAARELAGRFGEEYRISAEDEKKPFVEMSGRKGLGVKADDLYEILLERSREEIARRRDGESQGAAALGPPTATRGRSPSARCATSC